MQHEIQAENSRSTFGEYDNVDFLLTFEGRALLCNSIRLVGDLRVTKGGANLDASNNVYLDKTIGAHALVDQIQTSFQRAGVVESFTNYPRYVGMKYDATHTEEDACVSEYVCELRQPFDRMMKSVLEGSVTDASGSTYNQPVPFSIKPDFVLNSATGKGSDPANTSLSYNKSGAIRVVFTLNRVGNVLWGQSVDATCTYSLTNLRLQFLSVPDNSNTTFHRVKYHIKQSVLSSQSNIQTKVPAVCNAVSCSFVKQSDETALTSNAQERQRLPQLDQLQFLFNNATNELVQYVIDDRTEVDMRYIRSFKDVDHSRFNLKNIANNNVAGVGLDFQQPVNLANQTFSIILNSADNTISANPRTIHLYFHSFTEV
jgi:hypothetical protein